MLTIDSHTHIFAPELIRQRERYIQLDAWFGALYNQPTARMAGADDLLSAMRQAAIDRCVVFGFAFADGGLCREGNDYVLAAAAAHPERFSPFAQVNPADGSTALIEARRCLEAGARGLGELMPDGQGFALDDAALLDPLMELARAHYVPVLLHVNERVGHTYRGKGDQGPEAAYRLACRYPQNRLILAHWGGGLPFYELMPEVRQALRNVYYDTAASPYLYDDAVFAHVLAWAGDKVLFGSDYPLISQARLARRVQRLGLAEPVLARLMGGNALVALGRFVEGAR
jgi:hypothetical protein